MNRRTLLSMIGIAPIATAAVAFPRVADPVKLASTGGREVSAEVPFMFNEGTLHLDNVNCGIGSLDAEAYREMREDLEYKIKWMAESVECSKREVERLNALIR